MTRTKSSTYRREATRDLFELELDNGAVVVFQDPNKLPTGSVWELNRNETLEGWYQTLLSEADYKQWWDEYEHRPQEETVALQVDVMTFFRS